MSQLDFEDRRNAPSEVIEVDLDTLLARLTFGSDPVPTDAEAAAIATAIGAHLTDRARANAETDGDTSETVSQWRFSGRLARTGKRPRRRPPTVKRGDEWRAATRSR
ncbi:MAG: hypothetical protein ABEI77_03075 [Halorientalis sp.]